MEIKLMQSLHKIKRNAENIANKSIKMEGKVKLDIVFIVQEIKSFTVCKQVEKINVTANFISDLDDFNMEYDTFFDGKEIPVYNETIYKNILTDIDFKVYDLDNLKDNINCSVDFVKMYNTLLFNKNADYRISCKKYVKNM